MQAASLARMTSLAVVIAVGIRTSSTVVPSYLRRSSFPRDVSFPRGSSFPLNSSFPRTRESLSPSRYAGARDPVALQPPSTRQVRVLLAMPRDEAQVRASASWTLLDKERRVIARGQADEAWLIQRDANRIRALDPAGRPGAWREGAATLEMADTSTFAPWNGRRYRGQLTFVPGDTALLVVNKLDVEDYLRGVVPLEVGTELPDAHAAIEAQAVAARSYTYTHMLYTAERDYDLKASTSDQVYGGVGAETFLGDLATAATAGWVLSYAGRVVSAPYHSTCGGSTSPASEVWRSSSEPYLQAVSDRIPGTNRFYCDGAPRFRWERTLTNDALSASAERYGRPLATAGPVGAVNDVVIDGRTPSGRVGAIVITTDRTRLRVVGNDIRNVLRTIGGEILPSTYFSLQPVRGDGNRLVQLIVRGQGYGHGVGMCQWGAIGRARSGQDFRAILRAYYPGVQLVRAP